MATEQHIRNKGNLFENGDKRKPSQPDMKGDATIDGVAYDVSAWRRDEQLTVSLAPARTEKNTYPPDAFRGALDAVPKPKSKRGATAEVGPVWTGDIIGEERSYSIRAFQKQGKSGEYLTLAFEPIEQPARESEPDPDPDSE